MYFKTYIPTTRKENCARARAARTFNAVCELAQTTSPRFDDYVRFRYEKMNSIGQMAVMMDEEAWLTERKAEWDGIKELIHELGTTSPNKGNYVYFLIFNNGMVKNGETNNLVQRFSNLDNENDGINQMWYTEVANKEQRKVAEHAVHCMFDRSRAMNRVMGKKDYYASDVESAHKYMTSHKRLIWEAIMEAIGAEE